jgi:general secretion pathway protein J
MRGAFSREVDAGSHQENATRQRARAPLQCNRSGKGSVAFSSEADAGSRSENATRRSCSAHRHRGADGQAGFTIVELLISLTILTMIMAFIPGTLRIGQRVWEVDQSFERREALSAFRRYVEQRLAEAMPISLRDRTGGLSIEFTGESGRISFVAPGAAGPGGGGVYRFELTRAEGPAGRQPLVLRQSIYRYSNANQEPENRAAPKASISEQRSHAAVASLAFRYFGSPEAQKPPQWQSQWTRRDALPDLVEISLVAGDRAATVERTVVQLRLTEPRAQ